MVIIRCADCGLEINEKEPHITVEVMKNKKLDDGDFKVIGTSIVVANYHTKCSPYKK